MICWRKLLLRVASDSEKNCAHAQSSFEFPIPVPIPSKFPEKRMSHSPIPSPSGFKGCEHRCEILHDAFEKLNIAWASWRREGRLTPPTNCIFGWSHKQHLPLSQFHPPQELISLMFYDFDKSQPGNFLVFLSFIATGLPFLHSPSTTCHNTITNPKTFIISRHCLERNLWGRFLAKTPWVNVTIVLCFGPKNALEIFCMATSLQLMWSMFVF